MEKKLRNLKLNKAAGMDGIHSNILKTLSEEISLPLCMIFRKSLDEGIVPLDWRAAEKNTTVIKLRGCSVELQGSSKVDIQDTLVFLIFLMCWGGRLFLK